MERDRDPVAGGEALHHPIVHDEHRRAPHHRSGTNAPLCVEFEQMNRRMSSKSGDATSESLVMFRDNVTFVTLPLRTIPLRQQWDIVPATER
jgi:hypothetical protein